MLTPSFALWSGRGRKERDIYAHFSGPIVYVLRSFSLILSISLVILNSELQSTRNAQPSNLDPSPPAPQPPRLTFLNPKR